MVLAAMALSLPSSSLPASAQIEKPKPPEAPAQKLTGHMLPAALTERSLGLVEESQRLNLAIGLPLRNQQALDKLREEMSTPGNPQYRHFLTPQQFAAQFGPTQQDYNALIAFMKSKGFAVTQTYANRTLLDVSGTVADIQNTFGVKLNYFERADKSRFYAPDREPTVNLATRLSHITGLDNYHVAHPAIRTLRKTDKGEHMARPNAGSGPQWPGSNFPSFMGDDFRAAYLPGVSLSGAGQSVALFEFDGFNQSDVTAYENYPNPHLANVKVTPVLVDGATNVAGPNADEVTLDIDMVISMAPGLSQVLVYEAPLGATSTSTDQNADDLLNRIAMDNLASQISCSWTGFGDANTQPIFDQFAMQGQTFFIAAGDSGSYVAGAPVTTPPSPTSLISNMTVVGGTQLTTTGLNGAAGSYVSETTWNDPDDGAGGGGIVTTLSAPPYQNGFTNAQNGASTTSRNIPDVSMLADDLFIFVQGGGFSVNNKPAWFGGGTSAAAPLWAAVTALANQQAAQNHSGPLGFANPTLYSLARGGHYNIDFHDIKDGSTNSLSSANPKQFTAVASYDLTTGLGSPSCALINDLAPPAAPPPTFSKIDIAITTGGDDLRKDSAANAVLQARDGSTIQTFALKGKNQGSWDNNSPHDLVFTLNKPLTMAMLGSIQINLVQGGSFPETADNWNVQDLNVKLLGGPNNAQVSLLSLGGDPLVRLTGSAGSATYTTLQNDCGAPVAAGQFTSILFHVTTGGDDLRGDSEATAVLHLPGGATESFELKGQHDGSWENGAMHSKTFQLNAAHPISAFGDIVVTLKQHKSGFETDDNWNVQDVEVDVSQPGAGETCLLKQGGNPLARLTGSQPNLTLTPGKGC